MSASDAVAFLNFHPVRRGTPDLPTPGLHGPWNVKRLARARAMLVPVAPTSLELNRQPCTTLDDDWKDFAAV
jgi:hypothetical protein